MKIRFSVYRKWWEKWLLKQKLSPHKYKGETDYIRSQCIVAILKKIEPEAIKLSKLSFKFGLIKIGRLKSVVHRDEFNKETEKPLPVYSDNQIASMRSKWIMNSILVFFFALVEGCLYFLTSSTFLAGFSSFITAPAGVLFAVILMKGVSFYFSCRHTYYQALDRYKAQEITENELKLIRKTFDDASWILIGTFLCIVIAGLSRVYFFEFIDHRGMSEEMYHSRLIATKLASAFSLVFTLVASFLMGYVKHELNKTETIIKQHRKIAKDESNQEKLTYKYITYVQVVLFTAEIYAEEYWKWVINVKRVLNMAEYDAKHEALHTEYYTLRSKPGFTVTDEIYNKYSVIQSAYVELFVYGVVHHEFVIGKIKKAAEMLGYPDEYVKEIIALIEESKKAKDYPYPFSANGNSKKVIKLNN